jgi:hypothetical protein
MMSYSAARILFKMTMRPQLGVLTSENMEIDSDNVTQAPSRDAPPLPWRRVSSSVLETQIMALSVTDVVLSFLTLADYARLSRTSKFLRAAVYESSHLFAENCGGLRMSFRRTGNHAVSIDGAATEIKSHQNWNLQMK